MNCEVCNQAFNLTNKLPLMLPCCGDTACKDCIINLAGGPQQPLCFCPINDCGEQNFNQDDLKPNRKLEKFLKQASGILCDKHPQSQCEFYCHTDNVMVCTVCVVTTHQNHKCSQIHKQELIDYNDKILELLDIEYERIRRIIKEIEAYQNEEKQMTNQQYLKVIEDAQAIINPRLSLLNKQQIKFPPFKQQKQEIYEEEKQKVYKVQPPPQNYQFKVEFSEEEKKQSIYSKMLNQSKINLPPREQHIPFSKSLKHLVPLQSTLIKNEQIDQLKTFLDTKQLNLELIYKGSIHGFTAKSFHEKCDKQGPTISVLQSNEKQVFGGYTSVPWSSESQWIKDSNAFLFSLSNNYKVDQYQNQESAVRHFKNWGPTFGKGYDLIIGYESKDFDQVGSCWIKSYAKNDNCTYLIPNAMNTKHYMDITNKFYLLEIEVFKVKLN